MCHSSMRVSGWIGIPGKNVYIYIYMHITNGTGFLVRAFLGARTPEMGPAMLCVFGVSCQDVRLGGGGGGVFPINATTL